MRCPRLNELPSPPSGRAGWPWTIESPPLSHTMPGGQPWPRISIVVASLNQAAFAEEMVRSVLLQSYPDIELIVVDGGSGSAALDVFGKYRAWLTWFVSEPDRGQSHAWNKALARVSGAIFNQLDTDDYLLPDCFRHAAEAHMQAPGAVVAGDVVRVTEGIDRQDLHRPQPHDLHAYVQWWNTEHHGGPGMFFPSAQLPAVGRVDESLHFLMDYEFTLRFLGVTRMVTPRFRAAVIRHHAECKSVKHGDEFVWECVQIVRPYQTRFPDIDARANREAAGVLFGFGVRRLLYGQGDAWRFIREGLRIHPLWAVYWLVPGWFLRKWTRRRSRS